MTETRGVIVLSVAGVLAFLLQIVLAPSIKIAGAMPNFVAVFVFIVAVAKSRTFGCVMPFAVGLVFDFLSGGPVGAMSFCFTLFSVVAARVFSVMDNDTAFMPMAVMGVGLLLCEITFALFLLAAGYNAGAFQAIVFRAIPCAVYDCAIAFILYPLVSKFFNDNGPAQPIVATQLR